MATPLYLLAFESSCDETSVAVVKDGTEILSNIIATQIASHQRFAGSFPKSPVGTTSNKLPSVPRKPSAKQGLATMIWRELPSPTARA